MMGDKSISPDKVPYLWLLLIGKKWNVTEISRELKMATKNLTKEADQKR